MQLNTMRTCWSSSVVVLKLVVAAAVLIGGAAETAAAPQLPQSLSSQFNPEARGYAAGYGYDGHAPVAVQVGKAVQYAEAPRTVAVGYGAPSFVYKPDLSAYAAASFPQVEQLHRFNPVVRPVHTVVPKVTAVEPSVTVQKTYVDVPVPTEYRPLGAAAVVVQDAPSLSPYNYYYNNYQLIDRK